MSKMVSLREDNIIYIVDPEFLDITAAKVIIADTQKYCRQLRPTGKPVLILLNMLELKGSDSETRSYIVHELTVLDFDRLAGYGANPLITMSANMMLLAHSIVKNKPHDHIKFFSDPHKAEHWLKNP